MQEIRFQFLKTSIRSAPSGGWVGQKKTKLILYSTLVENEVEVGVELGNFQIH